jgi:hypothetical protein
VILLELASQGIRGAVSGSGRATFRPGYVVVPAAGDAFCATVAGLLWCEPADAEALRAAPGMPVRAGATFTARDRTLYRLVTDFTGEFQLQRYDSAARTFSPEASGRVPVQSWIAAQTGLTSRDAFEDLLCVSAASLPSRAAAPARLAAAPPPPSREPERIRARLAELREDLRRSQQVDELQRAVDELQSSIFKVDEALREGERLQADLGRAEERLRTLGPVATAADELGDVDARLAAHERATARHAEAMARIAEDREGIEQHLARPPKLWKLPQLWAGLLAGGAALAAGVASTGALRYVALLDVPAFGWSAWTALRWVGRLEAGERAVRRSRIVDERERKVREQWEAEAGPVNRALVTAGIVELADLRAALEGVAEARAAGESAAAALAEWQARPETVSARAEHARLDAELKQAEEALAALTTEFVRDVGTLDAEIARLEGELDAEEQPRRRGAAAAGASEDPLADLVRRVHGEIGPDDELGLARLEARASELLAVIAGRRLEGLWAHADGQVVVQPAGGKVRFRDLPPEGRDLCWTALKLAILEHAVERGRGFAVVDSALDPLPLVARRVAAHILKRAARSAQVLHATSDAVFREAADHSA